MREDDFHSSQADARSQMGSVPSFLVTSKVNFKAVTVEPVREATNLPPVVTRLVSLVGLGAVLLGPMSACSNSSSDSSLPCPVPTSSATGKTVTTSSTNIKCTTSSGQHYLWISSHGGWVPSDDGEHPNANAKGVGVDEGHSSSSGASDSGASDGHSGVGDGSSGAGHGGGDGG